MSEQNPLTVSQLIKVLKEVKKQAGDLPVMFYIGEENGVNQCNEPKDIVIMEDRDREEGDILRKFALIK